MRFCETTQCKMTFLKNYIVYYSYPKESGLKDSMSNSFVLGDGVVENLLVCLCVCVCEGGRERERCAC